MPKASGFNKDNIDSYLKEVSKEYRKSAGKHTPADIILIGGAAILTNYGFRENTHDVDALIIAASSMKDAINRVGDKYNLPNGWLNCDFKYTSSFTSNLVKYAKYYRTFSNAVRVSAISAEYLIAMKLISGRKYKHDLSDIVGIINEHQQKGNPIDYKQVVTAFENLYGDFNIIPKHSKDLFEAALNSDDLSSLMVEIQKENKYLLII